MSAEHTFCGDCGVQAWRFWENGRTVHEDFYVTRALWDATCPDDGVVLCIGCFERRLGRRLVRADFTVEPHVHTAPWPGRGTPPSQRFVDRWDSV